MARYIDADLMIADIQRYLCATCSIHCPSTRTKNSACEIAECLRMIDNAPTADVELVRHGRWINKGDYSICSICGGSSGTQYDGLEPIPKETAYCPHCSAKMDGDAE